MNSAARAPASIVHIAIDEAGALASPAPIFVMAAVVAARPEPLRNLIRRVALRSGKRLDRPARNASELKWSNASRRTREAVLAELADTDVRLYTLTVLKAGRRIEDSPQNYAALACDLLSRCWESYPNAVLALDRHFTAPAQIAVIDTFIHRCWPLEGVVSVAHVDSQRNALVQLADMVAGSAYSLRKDEDKAHEALLRKVGVAAIEDWRHIKARWLGAG
jgi:hypothetical protein